MVHVTQYKLEMLTVIQYETNTVENANMADIFPHFSAIHLHTRPKHKTNALVFRIQNNR